MISKQNYKAALLSILFLFLALFFGCNKPEINNWSDFIPRQTLFVIVPDTANTVDQMLAAAYMPMLDDMTTSAVQFVSIIQEHTNSRLIVDALLLFPDTANGWQPVWITESVKGLRATLINLYQKRYEQNQYKFGGYTIEKLFFSDRTMFMLEFGNKTVFSESSMALEHMVRIINGTDEPLHLNAEQYSAGSFISNTRYMDRWIQQLAKVLYRPYLIDFLKGSSPISFHINPTENKEWQWQLKGDLKVSEGSSGLVASVSSTPGEFTLDHYIPVNAAGFSIFRVQQQIFPDSLDLKSVSEADQYIESSRETWYNIEQNLKNEVAFVSFANSGPSSSSEFLFLRTIQNTDDIRATLDELAEEELILKDENTYFIKSFLLGKLFGTSLFPVQDFYITVYNNIIALSQRKGLAESITGDTARRRVIYYDEDYNAIRNSLPRPLSSIHYINAAPFEEFIQPWLSPQNNVNLLLSKLDQFVITTRKKDSSTVEVLLTSIREQAEERPFTEQWIFPLGDAEITGTPVLADLTGSTRDEVIFSTKNGSVYALATDGTVVLQASTNMDEPVGSPVVYDWYGNNQKVIMQAAGNKVYAWNQSGELLPNFPVILTENITTPLTVADITGNGVAEMILATANREVHILNARGQAINGWPQSTNAVVHSKPLIATIDGEQSLFAFAENTLHAWDITGERREGYPVFLTAQIKGSPHLYENHILGSGLDGNLYSVGSKPLFADSLSNSYSDDSLHVQSLLVSNRNLNATPSDYEVLLASDDNFERKSLILVQAGSGSLFLYDASGELQFTSSMGQPSSENYQPVIVDINNDQREDLVALADFGRLYAWDILSGERQNELPTSGMRYPVISNFMGDGRREIIAQTREGLQCWTVNFTVRESTEGSAAEDEEQGD